jgi:hypothetical protein
MGALPASDPVQLLDRIKGTRGDTSAPRIAPVIISADALMAKQFPEPRWALEGILAMGLSILAGAPKLGKSWLMLNVALAIAHGGIALSRIKVQQGAVLYCALEDTPRRLQDRLRIALQDEPAPADLHFATEMPSLADGVDVYIRQWLHEHPDARLVIVDTFAKVRGAVPGSQNLYSLDYEAMGRLKRIADEYDVALVAVHHTRKMSAEDPLDMVSGTAGLAGAADSILVLKKEIGRSDGTLYLRGRDVPESDHALKFDPDACTWSLLGDAETYRMSKERQEIVVLLTGAPAPMSPKQIAEALNRKPGAIRKLLYSLSQAGTISGLGGTYAMPPTAPVPDGWEAL